MAEISQFDHHNMLIWIDETGSDRFIEGKV